MLTSLNAVLSTPELLERVLLHLDMRTLLTVAHRVCHTWHNLITESPSLQKHLFFRPAPETSPRIRNPLLCELFPPWFPSPISEEVKEDPKPGHDKVFSSSELDLLPLAQEKNNAAFMYERASWRRMLVQQPPPMALAQFTVWYAMVGPSMQLDRVVQKARDESCDSNLDDGDIDGGGDRETEPLRMNAFYDLVTKNSGISHGWLFIWDDPEGYHHRIPAVIHWQRVPGSVKSTLEGILAEYGVIMFEFRTVQCVVGSAPWKMDDRFVFKGTDYTLLKTEVEMDSGREVMPGSPDVSDSDPDLLELQRELQ